MKKTLLSLVFSGLLFAGYSQTLSQTIKGQITDQQSRTPLIGATVLVVGIEPPLGGVTDVEGYFRIDNVPIGRQTLNVSSIGYEAAVLSEILVGSGKELVLNVSLKESLLQMEEVVITADSEIKGEPRSELATVSAISLSVEQTSRFAATFDDPARAALTYAGVQTGGDDLLNEIVIRGNSPKGILWRLEGVEIPNPNHFTSIGSSGGGISMLSSNVLSNSDFFTGAFPAQYGNATSGIFDLQLRQGNFDKREHSFQAGLLGVAASSEGPLSKSSKSSYLLNYRYSTLAMLTSLGLDLLGEREEIIFQDLSFKVRVPTKKLGSFSFWGLGGDNSYTFIPDTDIGETDFENEDQATAAIGVTNVFYVSDDSFFETILSGSFNKLTNNYDSLRILVLEREDFVEDQLRFSTFYNHKFSARHTLRIGGIYSNLGFDLKNRFWNRQRREHVVSLDANDRANFYQGFTNWQFRANEKLTINTGLHFSYFALSGKSYLEPRAGFKWNSGSHIFSGGFGLHSRMETVALYLARQEQSDGSFEQRNKDLGFTRAAHAVLGYQKQLKPDLRFKAEIYYQSLFDVPVWPNDTTSSFEALTFSAINTFDGYTTSELANDGTGKNFGVELTLEKFFTKGYYFLSTLSIYESRYKGADGVERSTQFDGGYIFNILSGREFKIGRDGNNSLGFNWKVIASGGKRQAPIDFTATANQGFTVYDYERNFELQLDNFFRIDVGFSYRKNKEKTASVIALNIQNLTQRESELQRFAWGSATQLSFLPNLSYKLEF
ncbi:MAG: TonB-dependent receptor [Cyclobacteriaceae bacterium]